MVDEARRISFDRQAALYDAVRPSYHPRAAAELAGLGTRVLEVGAGTGKATELLAGFDVTALEPGPALAAVLRAKQLPNVTVVESRFEDFAGTGFDIVLAAQAWHWIDPARRFALAAAAAPTFALFYNVGSFDPAIRAELDTAYARYFPPSSERYPANPVPDSRATYVAEIRASGLYGEPRVTELPWTQRYTTAQYLELIATYSDHAVLAPDARAGLFAEIAAAIDHHGGTMEMPYVTLVVVARRLG